MATQLCTLVSTHHSVPSEFTVSFALNFFSVKLYPLLCLSGQALASALGTRACSPCPSPEAFPSRRGCRQRPGGPGSSPLAVQAPLSLGCKPGAFHQFPSPSEGIPSVREAGRSLCLFLGFLHRHRFSGPIPAGGAAQAGGCPPPLRRASPLCPLPDRLLRGLSCEGSCAQSQLEALKRDFTFFFRVSVRRLVWI